MSWCHYARAHGKCVKQWRLHSLQDKQSITRKFFEKISEDCNFGIFFENSENSKKYTLLKNTRSTVLFFPLVNVIWSCLLMFIIFEFKCLFFVTMARQLYLLICLWNQFNTLFIVKDLQVKYSIVTNEYLSIWVLIEMFDLEIYKYLNIGDDLLWTYIWLWVFSVWYEREFECNDT